MDKIKYILCIIFIIAASISVQAKTKRALILYDSVDDIEQPGLTDARYLANLLGHFDTDVTLAPISEYIPGVMDSYDIVFYMNYESELSLPEGFKSDIFKYKNRFCWLNNEIGELDQARLKEKIGFHFKQYSEKLGFNKIIYKGFEFTKGDETINIVEIDNPGIAKVKAYALNAAGMKVPYIVNSGTFWFVADSPFAFLSEKDRYIAFADILHDIVGENHGKKHIALVRLEDVSPESDPKSLLKAAQYLNSEKIPFAVALVPVYINPPRNEEIHLSDNAELLSVLKKIPGLGGSFVLHGYTHQYKGVSTEDYELWDSSADRPVDGDSMEYASSRIEKGLTECFTNGIYPYAWETPHYFASGTDYLAIKKYFNVVYERRKTMEYLGSEQLFPYPVTDIYGEKVIPENLGYIMGENPQPQEILVEAKLNLAVRDGYASFFFHPFLKIEYLKTVINGLRSIGYKFGDIRDFSPAVSTKNTVVLTRGRHDVTLETKDKYISVKEYDYKGAILNESLVQNITLPFHEIIKCPKSKYFIIQGYGEPVVESRK